MKNKSYVLTRTATAFLIGCLAFVGFAVYFFSVHQTLWGWLSFACSIFFLITTLPVPLFYVIDKNGIRIRYITGDKENYEWKNVRGVYAEYDTLIPYVFDTYRIDGDDFTVYMFYKEGRLERSARLAGLIDHYYGSAVSGLIPEELSGAARKRFKQSYGKTPEAKDAQAAERAARKTVRAAVSSLGEAASTLSYSYSYSTADGECEKRPALDYTYSLVIKKGASRLASIKLLSFKCKSGGYKLLTDCDVDYVRAEIEKLI